MMRIRPGLALLIGCCASLTACAASAPKGPNVTVHAPAVGRPQPPASVEAALSRDAFSPYAALGLSDNDGLAPNESQFALAQTCMSDAGYANVNAGTVPMGIRMDSAGLAFAQPWGDWGYLGDAAAQQYGFLAPPGSALTQLGVDFQPTDPTTLPQAEQTAAGKCATIVQNFSTAVQDGPLAGIATLSNDISSDVAHDPAVKKATRAWSACMSQERLPLPQPGPGVLHRAPDHLRHQGRDQHREPGQLLGARRRSSPPRSPTPPAPTPPTWPGSTSPSRPATSSSSSTPTSSRSPPPCTVTAPPTPGNSASSGRCSGRRRRSRSRTASPAG